MATLDVLRGLALGGFACQAFCTSRLDFREEVSLETIIAEAGEPHQVRASACGSGQARLLYTRRHGVAITIVRLDSTRKGEQSLEEVRTVLDFFRTYLNVYRPDMMLTYGGDPVTQGMIALAKRCGIPVVFAIHNFAYTGLAAFGGVDCCVARSEFACWYYRDRLGLACQPLPNPVDWDRVRGEQRAPRFVTFVNPLPEKGVYPFGRIAHELGRRRPDIPLLVVEGRGTRVMLAVCTLGRESVQDGIPTRERGNESFAAVLATDADHPDALAMVGESAADSHRGDDQRHTGDWLRPRRHPRDARRRRLLPAPARSAHAGQPGRAGGRRGRALNSRVPGTGYCF